MLVCAAAAAPYVPQSDDQVVERLPLRADDRAARELAALRAAWRRDPRDIAAAVRLAAAYIDQAGAEGDPRYVGYAQSTLQPWWRDAQAPAAVRVMRAIVLQYDHRFDDALADLDAAVRDEPDDAQAWAWITAIHLVRADLEPARRACDRLAELSPELVGAACHAQIDALTGHATQAATSLRSALHEDAGADPALRLWVLTRLAETEALRGDVAAAERAFGDALKLALLKDKGRADVLLLRLAIAAKAAGDDRRDALTRELAARFDAARARGDTSHRKEEARFTLALLQQPERALELARANYEQQREVADARIVLEAALAARQRDGAQPVLQWMDATGIESPVLRALAAKLRELP
ncbi:MAG TPA: hypothetical protein VFK10_10015 [Burkholderiaceae bacterium]|nr:hypothetical protein [Burkholderiaceae bacterium]